jgi:hypothetical protein
LEWSHNGIGADYVVFAKYCMKKKYNWNFIQSEYNKGMSQSQLYQIYGVSPRAIVLATMRGDFVSRNKRDAGNLHNLTKEPIKHSEEFKLSQRNRIIARYETGWMPKAGRCKKYKYVSPIAGEIYLDGTWELAVAKWLDENQYNWKRNTKRFQYINLKGLISHYVPDFWVEELGGYLEVKGYETDLDRCKWSQFNETLIVWKRKDLKEFKILL